MLPHKTTYTVYEIVEKYTSLVVIISSNIDCDVEDYSVPIILGGTIKVERWRDIPL
ncbi:hypothetical protein LOAG_13172, partial [Loa loa]